MFPVSVQIIFDMKVKRKIFYWIMSCLAITLYVDHLFWRWNISMLVYSFELAKFRVNINNDKFKHFCWTMLYCSLSKININIDWWQFHITYHIQCQLGVHHLCKISWIDKILMNNVARIALCLNFAINRASLIICNLFIHNNSNIQ